jgi:prepilin-type N-terminal cleavage/methylation domain-containing protein
MESKKAFTLIELVIVISIVAILSLILVQQVLGYINNSKEVTCISNRKQLENQLLLGLVSNRISEQDIIDTNGKDLSLLAAKIGIEASNLCPEENMYILHYNNGLVTINCSVHDGEEDDVSIKIPLVIDDIILTDSSNKEHTIISNIIFDDIKNSFKNNGLSLNKGDTITDGEKTFAILWNSYLKQPSNEEFTLEDLAERNNLIEINNKTAIYTNQDIINKNGKHWESSIASGSIAYYNNNYYIAPSTIGKYTLPPGGWIQLSLNEW